MAPASFLGSTGACRKVYVHNYTRDITATRPENFAELTEEEKALIRKLGTYIKDPGAQVFGGKRAPKGSFNTPWRRAGAAG